MSYPILLQTKQTQNLKQTQKLIMLPQMQQAIYLLQVPIMELAEAIEAEMEKNPLLEYSQEFDDESLAKEVREQPQDTDTPVERELHIDEQNFEILKQLDEDFRDHFLESGTYHKSSTTEDDKYKTYQESLVCAEESLFEHLMRQAKDTFNDQRQLQLAEQIIGNLDQNGFLQTSLNEIALLTNSDEKTLAILLEEIKTFEPYGVGAKDLHDSLLIQLKAHGKSTTLAYKLVSEHYEQLLHNRMQQIQHNLGCTSEEIHNAIDQIAKLDFHPGLWYSRQVVQHIVPDITLRQEEDNLIAEMDDDLLPSLRLNKRYLRMLEDDQLPQETKDFIKHKVMSAKWLMRNIYQRNNTLMRIVESLAKIQKDFFMNPDGKLTPITMKVLAEELDLHESTIARAVSNKYLNCSKGILPLRSFFTTAYVTENGDDISSKTVQEALSDLIDKEDKKHPLSDGSISTALKEKGINCARRTVSKHRTALNIGNASQRKKF